MRLRRHGLEWLVCALVLAAAAWSPRLMPHNMDEFSAYQVLGCLHSPLSLQYNDFDISCHAYDLKLAGTDTWLPLRSYTYLGAAQAVFFLPFWEVFHSPVAGRLLGAVCLLFASWCIARLARVRWRHALLASLILPVYAMAYPEETGSAALPVCSVLAVLLLIRNSVTARLPSRQLGFGLLTGLTAFLGIYMKPVFLWAVPALLIWACWVWYESLQGARPALAKTPWRALLGAVVAVVVPAALLLTAMDRDGRHYYQVTASGGLTLHPLTILYSAYYLGMLVTDSALFNKRVLSLPDNLLLDAVPFMLVIATLLLSLWRGISALRRAIAVFLAMGAVTFGVICTNSSAWAPHHLIFAVVFLVLALAVAIGAVAARWPRLPLAIGVVSALYWATLIMRLPQAYILRDTDFDKDRLVTYLHDSGMDRDTVQVHSDWGTYYLAHTFGDARQLVIGTFFYWHPRDEQRQIMARVRDLSLQLRRDVLLIGMEGTGTRDDPLVRDALGAPVKVYHFNTWTIARFRPGATSSAPAP